MKIRPFDSSIDTDRVRELYEQRDPDKRLNPNNPVNMAALVAEDENGKVVGYFVARPFIAIHTVVDDSFGEKRERFEMIMEMARDMAKRTYECGMREAVYECPAPYERMGDRIAQEYDGVKLNTDRSYLVTLDRFLGNWEGK